MNDGNQQGVEKDDFVGIDERTFSEKVYANYLDSRPLSILVSPKYLNSVVD